jgi:hypothetical protein
MDITWIEESMDCFYTLAEHLDNVHGEQLSKISLGFTATSSVGGSNLFLNCANVTTIELKYKGCNTSTKHVRNRLTEEIIGEYSALDCTKCPSL